MRDQVERLQRRIDDWKDSSNRSWAAMQGAATFVPSMLPELWSKDFCAYSNPVYREAWHRGLYSAACWYLLDRIVTMNETLTVDTIKAMQTFVKRCPNNWNRIPGGAVIKRSLENPETTL